MTSQQQTSQPTNQDQASTEPKHDLPVLRPPQNWIMYLEGYGPTHNGSSLDANGLLLEMMKKLLDAGHRLQQTRFTADRPEENFLDAATLDLHEQLVELGVKAGIVATPTKAAPMNPAPPPGSGIPNAP